jgi:hypothetical protein
MKIAVFCVFAPCCLEKFSDVSEVLAASVIRATHRETASSSETSVNFYQATRHNNPEDSHLQKLLVVLIRNTSKIVLMVASLLKQFAS